MKLAMLVALAALCVPGPGLAQTRPPAAPANERPPMPPTRDAVLGYHVLPGAGEAIDVRVTIRAGGKGLRMDLPDQTYMIAQPETRSVALVVPLERTVADLPWEAGPQPLFLLDERMGFTRKNEATIAGQRCTQWEGALDKARTLVCVTADGLVLRQQFQDPQGRRNLVEAFVVQFDPARASDFVVPTGFDRLLAGPRPAAAP